MHQSDLRRNGGRIARSQIDHPLIIGAQRAASSLQANRLRIQADPFVNLLGRTDGGGAIAQNRDCFDFRPLVAHSMDFSVAQNQIGESQCQ
jgi:hypothetical protein